MGICIHFDADDVGSHLELLLLDGKLDEAVSFSNQVTNAMLKLRESIEQVSGAQVHLFGGDDLIATFQMGAISENQLNELRQNFESICGLTLSAGIGLIVQEALANLRRAKLSGKNRIVGNV